MLTAHELTTHSPIRVLGRGVLLVFLLSLLAVSASAQVNGRLSGTIEDPTGQSVPGARVTLLLPDSSIEDSSTITSKEGTFFFPAVRPVFYDLKVEAANFKTQTLKGVKIDALAETSLPPIELEIGDVREQVDVTAPVQTLQTSTGEVAE